MIKRYIHFTSRRSGSGYSDYPSKANIEITPSQMNIRLNVFYNVGSKEGREKMKKLFEVLNEEIKKFGYNEVFEEEMK